MYSPTSGETWGGESDWKERKHEHAYVAPSSYRGLCPSTRFVTTLYSAEVFFMASWNIQLYLTSRSA